jgi:hypothetical protein
VKSAGKYPLIFNFFATTMEPLGQNVMQRQHPLQRS